jgi:hypothetical protein
MSVAESATGSSTRVRCTTLGSALSAMIHGSGIHEWRCVDYESTGDLDGATGTNGSVLGETGGEVQMV